MGFKRLGFRASGVVEGGLGFRGFRGLWFSLRVLRGGGFGVLGGVKGA